MTSEKVMLYSLISISTAIKVLSNVEKQEMHCCNHRKCPVGVKPQTAHAGELQVGEETV